MAKPQQVAKVENANPDLAPGWRIVFSCTNCARAFTVSEADAPDVWCCPFCGKGG